MIKNILPERFIPAPYPLIHSYKLKEKTTILTDSMIPEFIDGVKYKFASLTLRQCIDLKPKDEKWKFIPFDFYCPSVHTQLARRVCKECKLYFASIKSATAHKKIMHKKKKSEILTLENVIDSDSSEELEHEIIKQEYQGSDDGTSLSVIENIEEWIASPWTDE